MRFLLPAPLLFGFVLAQDFVPDTTGFDAAVGSVMAVALTLATVSLVVGIIYFVVQLWMHRG